MNFRQSLALAGRAARLNLLPGLLLWGLMLAFLAAYLTNEPTKQFLERVADLKKQSGFLFDFICYAIAAGMLPELLRVAFFERGRFSRRAAYNILTGIPIWGCIGILVDLFYMLQGTVFGTGNAPLIVLAKMAFDQFVFSPFLCTPLSAGTITWRDNFFKPSALRWIVSLQFYFQRVIPAQVAGWCVWIPGTCLVYFMPPLLQIPVAVTIQVFWVLLFTTVVERSLARGV
jgi:hypothetical protein